MEGFCTQKQQLIEICHRIRNRRKELSMTREKFAELADISVGFYAQIEVGASQMSIDTLIKISKALRLSMEYIIFGTEYPNSNADAVIDMLNHCIPAELKLAKKVLKLFLMKS